MQSNVFTLAKIEKLSMGFYQNFELHFKFIFFLFLLTFQCQNGLVFEKLTISPKRIGYLGFGGKNVKVFQKVQNGWSLFVCDKKCKISQSPKTDLVTLLENVKISKYI